VCRDYGQSCGGASTCCDGLQCTQGKCGCGGATPEYCPEYGGACWPSGTTCASIVVCGSELDACPGPYVVNCATQMCDCPAGTPTFCSASGALPQGCFPAGVSCDSRTACGSTTLACPSGQHVDCSTLSCVSDTPPPPPPPTVPAWVQHVWHQTGSTHDYAVDGSENIELSFNADGTYDYQVGFGAPGTGSFTVTVYPYPQTLALSGGPLSGQSLKIGTTFVASCRILKPLSMTLWSQDEIADCPDYDRVTSAECADVGTYVRHSTSGSTASGSGSETDTTDTIVLSRDHFFTHDVESLHDTCFNYSCSSTESKNITAVGAWSTAAGAAGFSLATLHGSGWTFTHSTAACPGP
jgi:hypothetical protein